MIDPLRTRKLNASPEKGGAVVYWMSRDQRARDNWALLAAQECAFRLRQPLVAVFCLMPNFLDAALRHYTFLLEGLREVEAALTAKKIPFLLLTGDPADEIAHFCAHVKVGAVFTDFDPLKIKRIWKDNAAAGLECAFYETDAHNIVPCWEATPEQEFAARTFRPEINKRLPHFLTDFPTLKTNRYTWTGKSPSVDWRKAYNSLSADSGVRPLKWLKPGEKEAHKVLSHFIQDKLAGYAKERNHPDRDAQSNLSPYLHFGQISAQRVALEILKTAEGESRSAFLEELIVRRELSDNYCFHNRDYDNWNGFPQWAKKTLSAHRRDPRKSKTPLEKLESAQSPDHLWNAAQMQMTALGKMHGFMRMYWAKRMLEWSGTPEEAQRRCIYLHDKYSIDGRDPNGYTGIAWSIGGVHDRAWQERPIFGKVRCMGHRATKSKIREEAYMEKVKSESAAELAGD